MYVINEQSKTPLFQINQHIGFDDDIFDEVGNLVQKGDGQGIDGKIFANEVLSLNGKDIDEILFYVNTQGGDVQQSIDMLTAISMSSNKTHSIITGFAFSCGGWAPLAADKVEMVQETGRWMCHMPYDPQNPETKSQFMDEVIDIISRTIASKSGRNGKPKKTQHDIIELMSQKTYWDAEKMHEEGLIDKVINLSGKTVKTIEKDIITLNKSELTFYYKENQVAQNKLITNEIKTQQKTIVMGYPKLINRLNSFDSKALGFKINLTEDSSEEVILDTIVRLENRLRAINDDSMDNEEKMKAKDLEMGEMASNISKAEKEVKEKAKDAEDAMCALNAMKEKYSNLEAKNKELSDKEEARNQETKDADLKFRKERATNFVDKLEQQGKLFTTESLKTVDEVKTYLVNKATEDFDSISTQFSIIPSRLSGPKPGSKNTLNNGEKADRSIIEKQRANNIERIKKNQSLPMSERSFIKSN